jgi:hypothetical protein
MTPAPAVAVKNINDVMEHDIRVIPSLAPNEGELSLAGSPGI